MPGRAAGRDWGYVLFLVIVTAAFVASASVIVWAYGRDWPWEQEGQMAASETTEPERYFLDTDNSSHWFIVPVSRKAEWQAWNELDEDDPASWDAPDFAEPVGGCFNLVTFTDPRID